jgi:hypothetical protein
LNDQLKDSSLPILSQYEEVIDKLSIDKNDMAYGPNRSIVRTGTGLIIY